jgi:hypothetical protein
VKYEISGPGDSTPAIKKLLDIQPGELGIIADTPFCQAHAWIGRRVIGMQRGDIIAFDLDCPASPYTRADLGRGDSAILYRPLRNGESITLTAKGR